VLTGYGGDPAFRVPLGYATGLLRRGRWWRLARETAQYVRLCGRLPGVSVRRHLRRCLSRPPATPVAPPAWLDPDLVARLDLRARLAVAAAETPPVHPTRPAAYAMLTGDEWSATFERHDAGLTGVPVDVRHPFFDVRLLRFLLAIPPLPWCFDKTILRLAMRGRLPEAVRTRPKTVAAGDAVVAMLRRPGGAWVDGFEPVAALGAYVRRDRVPAVRGRQDADEVWTNLRPLCLNYWLGWQQGLSTERRVPA
jgi:asparagine synthase (glutamine-hydrolysing)